MPFFFFFSSSSSCISSSAIVILVLLLHLQLQCVYPWDCPADPSACVKGPRHKAFASPEDDSYAQCFEYKSHACCTANFTQQLATSDVTHIVDGADVFSWDSCGPMSALCEDYFIEIECFYRCSPQLIYFEGAWDSSLDFMPICSQYCDHWLEACAADFSCLDNWIWGWDYDENGVNVCPNDTECLTFEERYVNGQGLCNTLWGGTFNYTDNDELCLTPGYARNNKLVVDVLFEDVCAVADDDDDDDDDDTCPCKGEAFRTATEIEESGTIMLVIGIVLFVVGLVVAGVALLCYKKKKAEMEEIQMVKQTSGGSGHYSDTR